MWWAVNQAQGFGSLPAAPAMCSSTLSRSSQAAGWMSPYISSVRIGAALISSDRGAGERLMTCNTPSHASGLSCANYPWGRTTLSNCTLVWSANYPPITSRFIHFRKFSTEGTWLSAYTKTAVLPNWFLESFACPSHHQNTKKRGQKGSQTLPKWCTNSDAGALDSH